MAKKFIKRKWHIDMHQISHARTKSVRCGKTTMMPFCNFFVGPHFGLWNGFCDSFVYTKIHCACCAAPILRFGQLMHCGMNAKILLDLPYLIHFLMNLPE